MKNLKLQKELNRRLSLPLAEYIKIMVNAVFESQGGNGKMNLKNNIDKIDCEVELFGVSDLTDEELTIVFPDDYSQAIDYQEDTCTLSEALNTVTI